MKTQNRVALAATFAIVSILSPIVRFFTESSSHFPIYPEPALFLVSLLLSFCYFCFLFVLFSLTSLLYRTKFPYEAIPNGLIVFFATLAYVLNFLDIGFYRSTQVRANPTFLYLSVFKRSPLFEIAYREYGARIVGSSVIEEIIDYFKINPVLFPVMTLFIIALVGTLAALLFVNFKYVLISFGFKLNTGSAQKKQTYLNVPLWAYIGAFVFGVAYSITFVVYLSLGNGVINHLDLVAPASWVFIKSGINFNITDAQEVEAIRLYREAVYLPEDRDWLDYRDKPVYPLVTASKAVVKAYNSNYNYVESEAAGSFVGKPPDIFVMLIESFSPTPFYMDKTFILYNESIYRGKMYDSYYLPNLARLQQTGIAFSGMSSNSLPTFGGWFSFVCGDYQQNYGSSMAQDSYNDLDDLPSSMRSAGYYTQYVSTSPLDFDGKMQYVFRGYKYLRGPQRLSAFPRWFDNVSWYFPSAEQADQLGLDDLPKPNAWVCDRITRHQVLKYLDEYNDSKPLFTLWTTVDTHTPFKGFDARSQYDEYAVGDGMRSSYTESGMSDRYSTILRYMDSQLGAVYDYLRYKRNNTIFVVLGDHGARDMNSFQHETDVKGATFSDACRGKAFGNEELFTTTGVISYLGDDPQVTEYFSENVGKVFTGPTDYQDMVYTLQKLVNHFHGADHVTSRYGRDLLQMFELAPLRHLSMRNTGLSLEVATEKQVTRSNYLTDRGAIVIADPVYPTCIAEKHERISALRREDFNKYLLISSMLTKLSNENRNFNYALRDTKCVEAGSCTYPTPTPVYKSPVLLNFYITLPCAMLIVCVLLHIICLIVANKLNSRYECIIDTPRWWNFNYLKRDVSEISIQDSYL